MPLAAIPLLFLLQTPPQEVVIRTHTYIPPQTTALSAETNLVESALVIRDNRGKPQGGFHAADFVVSDNGKAEEVVSFVELGKVDPAGEKTSTAASNAPAAKPAMLGKALTLFFDDLNTETGPLAQAVVAARKFMTSAMGPVDRVAIATSSGTADLDFTSDAAALKATLDRVRTHTRPPTTSCPALSPVEAYLFMKNTDADVKAQAINDAKQCICGPGADRSCLNSKTTVMAAPGMAGGAAEMVWNHTELQSKLTVTAMGESLPKLSAIKGSRIMIVLSTGFLPPLQNQLTSLATAAMRAGIVVHTLDTTGLDAEREGMKDGGFDKLHVARTQTVRQTAFWEPLEKMADGTGGHFFHNTNDLAAAIEMAAAPAISYTLAFNPGGRDGQFHTLKIAFKNKSPYTVQFRPGYFSPADVKKEATSRTAMDAAVFSKISLQQFPAKVALAAGQPKDGTIPVSVAVTVDMNQLEFKPEAGRHLQQIVFLMTLLDSHGVFVTGKEAIMDLALTDEKLTTLKKDGLKGVLTLNAPAGIYQVRTVVREGMKGNLSATTVPVDLRAN